MLRSPSDWYEGMEPLRKEAAVIKVANRVIDSYRPEDYIFTHNTILASVDVEGRVSGAERDHLITASTQRFINDNFDAWERGVVLNDWKTFIGAYNYLEHVQIPSESKGTIIDAAVRNLEDSLYVDILVATNKKHSSLCAKIASGEMNAMSMGCICSHTYCSKCGNRAVDETDLCLDVRYYKGSKFYGPDGKPRIISELCGDKDSPGSVQFIEASWVANPAFRGAVTRNIVAVSDFDQKMKRSKAFAMQFEPRTSGRSVCAYETAIDDTLPEEVYFRDRMDRSEEDSVTLVDRAWAEDDDLSEQFSLTEEPETGIAPFKLPEDNVFGSKESFDSHMSVFREAGFQGLVDSHATGGNLIRTAKVIARRDHGVAIPEPFLKAVASSPKISSCNSSREYLEGVSEVLGRKFASKAEVNLIIHLARLFERGT